MDDDTVAQLGPSRERRAGDAIVRELRIVDGEAALQPEPGWERIAFVPGLDAAEQAELEALEAQAAADAAVGRPTDGATTCGTRPTTALRPSGSALGTAADLAVAGGEPRPGADGLAERRAKSS